LGLFLIAVGTGEDQIYSEGLTVHLTPNPVNVDLQLIGREPRSAEYAHAASLSNGSNNIAAVRKGEDGEIDLKGFGDRGTHLALPAGQWVARLSDRSLYSTTWFNAIEI
jgi:hypothetical protein